MTKKWNVQRPLNEYGPEMFTICTCDSVEAVAAIVAALLRSGAKPPASLTISEVAQEE